MKARNHSVATGILVALAAAAASLVLPAGAVAADEPAAAVQVADGAALERSASEFLGLINSLRASRGLPALQVSSELTASAQGWAGSMASSGVLSHDPNLASAASGWTSIGENVGMGPTVSSIWAAFLASPQHLANLTSSTWTHVGVGFVRSGQAMWTTHRFMTLGAATPPPPPTAPPATAPPATAPPVTAPPPPVVTAPPAPVAPPAPPTVPVAPVTAPPPVPSSSGSGSGADGGDDGASESIAGDPSAEADRVAEVINALQALPG